MSTTAHDVVLDALAVHRLTRLAVADVITRPLRALVIGVAYQPQDERDEADRQAEHRRMFGPTATSWAATIYSDSEWEDRALADDDAPRLAQLVTCPWCAGIWIAAAVCVVRRTRWWRAVRVPLAMSSVAGLLSGME